MKKIVSRTVVDGTHIFCYADGIRLIAVRQDPKKLPPDAGMDEIYRNNNRTSWVLVKGDLALTGPDAILEDYMVQREAGVYNLVSDALNFLSRSYPSQDDLDALILAYKELDDECDLTDRERLTRLPDCP